MRNKALAILLASITVGAVGAQVGGPAESGTNVVQSAPATPQAGAPAGGLTNAMQLAPPINEKGTFGLGPMLGEPMGVSAKVWLSDKLALDGGLGWSFVDPDGCQLQGDVLFHKFDLLRADARDLPLYIGVGGRVKFPEHVDNRAGIRFPVGIGYLMPKQRLEFYAEVAPVLDVAPTTTLEWNGGIGIRYYFK